MTRQVVVLGTHRSGTSMVAGVIHKLGIPMGRSMVGADHSNPYGHYEDVEATAINRWLLFQAGGCWHNPPTEEAIEAADDGGAIVRYVRDRDANGVWGYKDPRTVLTIHRWLPHLSGPLFVTTSRYSGDIVASLIRRNGLSQRAAWALTYDYLARLNGFLATIWPWHMWSFEQAKTHPESEVERLATFLGVEPTQEAVGHIHA